MLRILICILLLASTVFAGHTSTNFVAGSGSGSSTSISASTTLNVPSGATVLAAVASVNNPTRTVTVGADTLTLVKNNYTSADGYSLALYCKVNATANASATVSATLGPAQTFRAIAAKAYLGLDTSVCADQSSCNSASCNALATASTNRTAQNVTTTVANSMLFSVILDWDGDISHKRQNGYHIDGSAPTLTFVSKSVTSTGSYPAGNMTVSDSQQYMSIFANFTETSGGAQPTIFADSMLTFEDSTDTTTITTTILGNSALNVGSIAKVGSAWRTISNCDTQADGAVSALTISTGASQNLPGPVNIGDASYSATGTRGMRATGSGNHCIQLDFAQSGYMLSIGFYFKWTGAQIDSSPRDLVAMRSDPTGGYQFIQGKDGTNPSLHIHWQPTGGSGVGSDVTISRGTWYWVTAKHVAGGGTTEMRVYDVTGTTLIGTSTGAVTGASTVGVTALQVGLIKYAAGSGQTYDYDNFMIDASGTFPLLPPTPSSRRRYISVN